MANFLKSLFIKGVEVDTASAISGQVLQFNGTKFLPASAAGGASISDTPPSSPSVGQIWYESDTGKTFVYYDSFWVEFSSSTTSNVSSGLVYVKSQTVGTGVSSVTLTNAFSAEYDSYRIVVSGIDCSVGDTVVSMTMGSASASYYSNIMYYKLGTGAGNVPLNNGSLFYVGITGTESDVSISFDVFNPYASSRTAFAGNGFGYLAMFNSGGLLADTNSYTSFTLAPTSGTFTGGTISVYGYKKA